MEELKKIIAVNIVELRKSNNLTQAELAEKLNYSDKAVSKWERGESIPDVSVLKKIADLFSVKVDYLLTLDHSDERDVIKKVSRRERRNRMMITSISIVLVWLVATLVFSNVGLFFKDIAGMWLAFVYAVPVSSIVWLVFNSLWFNKRFNFTIISFLLWSTLASIFLTAVNFGVYPWLLFFMGVPAQVIIALWSGIKIKRKKKI